MIYVNVLYPNVPDSHFDLAYYLDTHIPMVSEKLGSALKGVHVAQGVAGGAPGAPPAFAMICQLEFDSADAFTQAFTPHAEAIQGDIPNYTNIKPTVQISEVKL